LRGRDGSVYGSGVGRPELCPEVAVLEYHVLNLGAGVQSTTLYLMGMYGELNQPFDVAIFADPQDEPEAVYAHLDWLESMDGPPIIRATAGCLGDDLQNGRNSTGQRFASIPAFTAVNEGDPLGMVRRQCTREYKIEVIEKTIRRELIGLKPRQRMPKDVHVHQYIGFSYDEPRRAARMRGRYAGIPWASCHFPLIDEVMKRGDCLRWLEDHGGIPHETPRSACVFCPFHSDEEWRRVKENSADWERACAVDDALRVEGNVVNRGLDAKLYVHRSCRPLREVDLNDSQMSLFDMDCEGGCGL
jgi:hypothetical protein